MVADDLVCFIDRIEIERHGEGTAKRVSVRIEVGVPMADGLGFWMVLSELNSVARTAAGQRRFSVLATQTAFNDTSELGCLGIERACHFP